MVANGDKLRLQAAVPLRETAVITDDKRCKEKQRVKGGCICLLAAKTLRNSGIPRAATTIVNKDVGTRGTYQVFALLSPPMSQKPVMFTEKEQLNQHF